MNVLLADTNPELQNRLQRIIAAAGDNSPSLSRVLSDKALLEALQQRKIEVLIINSIGLWTACERLIGRALLLRPGLRVIVYSDTDRPQNILAALRAGAVGYILKTASLEELLDSMQIVDNGGAALSPVISRMLLRELQSSSLAEALPFLTKREKQVFECMEHSLSYKGISLKLNISRNTVHSHVKSIYSKLHAVDKHDALNKARQFAVTC